MGQNVSKEQRLREIQIKNEVSIEGLNFDKHIFDNLSVGEKYIEQVNTCFAGDRHFHAEIEFPSEFYSPKGGYLVPVKWNRKSPYELKVEDGVYILAKGNQIIWDNIRFRERPKYYGMYTSDGTQMRTVGPVLGYNNLQITYSNECALKDKGEACLFCNINETKATYGDAQNITWKTPAQIAETFVAANKEGYNHITVSGGFIPERREVEYYLDVAETILDLSGKTELDGSVTVGAPSDLSSIAKYKEAGYTGIATNLEVWHKNLFEYYCPGKARQCGGRENWVRALEEEVNVFGRYRVRSSFVSGLEHKESLLEGFEILSEKGVICVPSSWFLNVGSPLEGHRTPEPEWHWEVQKRTADIWRKNGIKWEDITSCAGDSFVVQDIFRLEEEIEVK